MRKLCFALLTVLCLFITCQTIKDHREVLTLRQEVERLQSQQGEFYRERQDFYKELDGVQESYKNIYDLIYK